jgi:hypothetical protein
MEVEPPTTKENAEGILVGDSLYPRSPSNLVPKFPYAIEEELKAIYLSYLYPYEWQKRQQLLVAETALL